jgi:prepilin-type N-terminal cleavage/methylation domain-containing protein
VNELHSNKTRIPQPQDDNLNPPIQMKTNKTQLDSIQRSGKRHHGFTLVEVLVVITIIVALAALVVVVTRNIKNKAFQANAMSSLRQVAAYNVAYANENNGDINTLRWVGDPKEGGGGSWVKNSYWGRLQPYLFPDIAATSQPQLKTEINRHLDQLLLSTDADKMAGTVIRGTRIYHDGSGLPVPFAFNKNLHQWGQFMKTGNFGNQSLVLYATYGFGFFDEKDGEAYAPMPRDGSMPGTNIYYMDDRKALASFLDGHVEAVSPPIPDRNYK